MFLFDPNWLLFDPNWLLFDPNRLLYDPNWILFDLNWLLFKLPLNTLWSLPSNLFFQIAIFSSQLSTQ